MLAESDKAAAEEVARLTEKEEKKVQKQAAEDAAILLARSTAAAGAAAAGTNKETAASLDTQGKSRSKRDKQPSAIQRESDEGKVIQKNKTEANKKGEGNEKCSPWNTCTASCTHVNFGESEAGSN